MPEPTIPVIISRDAGRTGTKGLLDAVPERLRGVVDVNTDALKSNLAQLVERVSKVVEAVEASAGGLALKEVQVGVEITADGGVALIGTASVGATASITLTFQRP